MQDIATVWRAVVSFSRLGVVEDPPLRSVSQGRVQGMLVHKEWEQNARYRDRVGAVVSFSRVGVVEDPPLRSASQGRVQGRLVHKE